MAAVQTGDRRIEVRSLLAPGEVGDDEALLAVEGNGMCGTDWEQYKGRLAGTAPYPRTFEMDDLPPPALGAPA